MSTEIKSKTPSVPAATKPRPVYDFSGRLVFVTGSTSGIGKAIAEGFLTSGADVIISGRSQKSVDSAGDELAKAAAASKRTGKLHRLVGDAGTAAGCASLIERVNAIGQLSVLVNNLGIYNEKPVFEISDDEWLEFFNVNVMSVIRMTRAFLPAMIKRKHGRVLNIGSEMAYSPVTHTMHYGMTKVAIANLSVGFAELTKGTEVTVNTFHSGPTATENFLDVLAGMWRDQQEKAADKERTPTIEDLENMYFKKFETRSIIQRLIRPYELADTAMFLASHSAGNINGSNIHCEGGILKFI